MSTRLRNAALTVLVLAVAAILRFGGLNWDDRSYPHPDERFLVMVSSALHGGTLTPTDRDDAARDRHRALCAARNPDTNGVGGWFDTECSDFNPAATGNASYPYGQLPLTFVRVIAEGAAAMPGWNWLTRYEGIHLVGRVVSACADLLTLIATFLLGRLVWGRAIGAVGAAFYAIAVLPIQSAHYWTVDSGATLAATVCIIFLVRIARFGQAMDVIAFGVAYGFALATKLSVLPLFVLLPLAVWWMPRRIAFAGKPDRPVRARLAIADVVIAAVAAAVSFRLASPYAFVGPGWFDIAPARGFLDQIDELRRIVVGVADIPPSWQWLGRTPWLSPGRDLLLWGLGLPLGIASVVGFARTGWRLLRGTPLQRLRALPWLWTLGYFLWMGQQWQSTMRYLLPIYPELCLFAAAWLVVWWRGWRRQPMAGRPLPRVCAALPAIALAVVTGATFWWAFAFHGVFTTLHPYVGASHWYLRNVPAAVAASIVTASGSRPLLNWPAGEFGDGVPPKVIQTRAPASGQISQVRLHHVAWKSGARTPIVVLRILDGADKVLAETAAQRIPFSADTSSAPTLSGVELPLPVPLAVTGGQPYRIQLEVAGAVVSITGSAIAHEGAWNDPLPTRVPWLPAADQLDLRGPSGTTAHDAPGVDPFGDNYYRVLDLDLVPEDNEAKRERMLGVLDAAEWISIPNNRFYDSITRNPLRFPLTTRFYDALFRGELGFERALTIATRPTFLGIGVWDQALPAHGQGVTAPQRPRGWSSEEAFTVYDHPAVFIFRKGSAYSHASAARLLEAVNVVDVESALRSEQPMTAGRLKWSSLEASLAVDGLLLPASAAMPVPAEADADPPHAIGMPAFAATMLWYAASLLLGFTAWPWLASLWPDLADRGYATARIAGLMGLGGSAWWLAWLGLPAWSTRGLGTLLILWVFATALFAQRFWKRERGRLRLALPQILRVEAVFLVVFLLGVALRLTNPDLWAPALGGEKPMDYALLNSILGTASFPAPDPWFSGGRINYYYFGWLMTAVLIKLTGVTPAVGYNLALATWYAMTGVAAFGLASNICAGGQLDAARAGVRKGPATSLLAGIVALLATVVMGNLDLPRAVEKNVAALQELLHRPEPLAAPAIGQALTLASERWYWAPSRTVGERPGSSFEVNEFPAFSFIHGDLHPHLMSMPLQLFLLTGLLALAWPATGPPGRTRVLVQVIVLGAAVAVLRATNSWDWPLYLALSILGAIAAGRRLEAPFGGWPAHAGRYERWGRIGLLAALLFVVQALVAIPFTIYFATGGVSLRRYTGNPTALASWLTMYGWFLAVLVPWSWRLSRAPLPRYLAPGSPAWEGLRILRALRWTGLAYTVAASAWALTMRNVEVVAIGLQVALLAWFAELFWRNAARRAEGAALAAVCIGLALSLAVEFVVIGQDLGRMNTFFKFHLQSWLLLSAASGVALASLIDGDGRRSLRRLYAGTLALPTLLALAYFPLAIYGRVHSRFDPRPAMTLDGESFLATAVYQFDGHPLRLADDYRIIGWLREHARQDDTVLEAQIPEYRWGSRIAAFTGRPTLLGYRYHEIQQRPMPELNHAVELRRANVAKLYGSTDPVSTMRVLRDYRVRFIVVGGLERANYPSAGLEKFAALAQAGQLRSVYNAGEDVVYEVPETAGADGSWPVF